LAAQTNDRTRDEQERRWRERMIAAQAGDAVEYERLLLELLPAVRAMVRRRIRDHGVIEDVVQNVLLSLHRARHTYRSERPFGPWLRAIARNAVIDWSRRRARRAQREFPLPREDTVPDPAPAFPEGQTLSPALEQALGELPEAQREAVRLLQVEGLSVAEAALRVGVTPGALKVRAHRGYRALRERLGRERK
jgi:RNA polymerase sigma-70 factor (ECF subfamily)